MAYEYDRPVPHDIGKATVPAPPERAIAAATARVRGANNGIGATLDLLQQIEDRLLGRGGRASLPGLNDKETEILSEMEELARSLGRLESLADLMAQAVSRLDGRL